MTPLLAWPSAAYGAIAPASCRLRLRLWCSTFAQHHFPNVLPLLRAQKIKRRCYAQMLQHCPASTLGIALHMLGQFRKMLPRLDVILGKRNNGLYVSRLVWVSRSIAGWDLRRLLILAGKHVLDGLHIGRGFRFHAQRFALLFQVGKLAMHRRCLLPLFKRQLHPVPQLP